MYWSESHTIFEPMKSINYYNVKLCMSSIVMKCAQRRYLAEGHAPSRTGPPLKVTRPPIKLLGVCVTTQPIRRSPPPRRRTLQQHPSATTTTPSTLAYHSSLHVSDENPSTNSVKPPRWIRSGLDEKVEDMVDV